MSLQENMRIKGLAPSWTYLHHQWEEVLGDERQSVALVAGGRHCSEHVSVSESSDG